MTSRDPDLRQPWPWPTLDVLLLRQVADDLELVADHGRRDDVVALARDARRACDDGHFADEQAAYWGRLGTAADALAIDVCAGLVDAATVRGVLAWHRHRRRLRAALAVVRDEAARLRGAQGGTTMSRPLVRVRVCSRANKIGQRLVVATSDGDEIHRDEFSVNDAARRQRFREAVAAKVPSSSLAWIDDEILQSAEAYDAEAAGKADGVRFTLYPAAKLAASEFRVEYLVDGILAAQQPAFVLGPHKALKTSLALDQAISLATGAQHLNRFKVPTPRRVLFMSGESGLSTLKETAERICRSKFADLAEVGNLVFSDMVPSLANAAHLSELGRVLAGEAVEVLYVDPLYLALDAGGNEASIFAMGAVLRGVSQLCQSHRVTLVLLHHLKRGNGQQRGPAELSDASWAGPAEFARQWCVVSRREPYRPGTGVHELWFNVGGSAGHNGLYAVTVDEGIGYGNRHWSVECLDAADALREQEADQQRRKADHHQRKLDDHAWQLRETLGRFGDGETVTALRTNARLNPANFDEAMGTLLGRGEAERCDVRKGNRSHEGFKPTARLLRRPDQPTRPDQNSIPQKLVG